MTATLFQHHGSVTSLKAFLVFHQYQTTFKNFLSQLGIKLETVKKLKKSILGEAGVGEQYCKGAALMWST